MIPGARASGWPRKSSNEVPARMISVMSAPEITSRGKTPESPWYCPRMSTRPDANPVTIPPAVTVATVGFDDTHVVCVETSAELLAARARPVSPAPRIAGRTMTLKGVGGTGGLGEGDTGVLG